jgi:hypothetical protein
VVPEARVFEDFRHMLRMVYPDGDYRSGLQVRMRRLTEWVVTNRPMRVRELKVVLAMIALVIEVWVPWRLVEVL